MAEDLRAHPRADIQINIILQFLQDTPHTVSTKNVSEGGLFLHMDNPQHYPLGELVNVKYQNPLVNNRPTEKDAVIVRTDSAGIAVAFIEMEAS